MDFLTIFSVGMVILLIVLCSQGEFRKEIQPLVPLAVNSYLGRKLIQFLRAFGRDFAETWEGLWYTINWLTDRVLPLRVVRSFWRAWRYDYDRSAAHRNSFRRIDTWMLLVPADYDWQRLRLTVCHLASRPEPLEAVLLELKINLDFPHSLELDEVVKLLAEASDKDIRVIEVCGHPWFGNVWHEKALFYPNGNFRPVWGH